MPIKMLNDRILVRLEGTEGERRSSGGILIPATAQVGKRLVWAKVVAVGPNVRAMEPGDQVLFSPDDTASSLAPAAPATEGYPQIGHGAIALSGIFRTPGPE